MTGRDRVDSLVVGPAVLLAPTGDGPLAGLEFVVKDVIDIAGQVTGAGNPTWAATHPSAATSAAVVEHLVAAGAVCVGRSRTDELAFSLSGRDGRGGQPINPVDPARLTGGSSSGSAAAVASGLVPFALGTDTAGSIRIPASYCGLVGVRPTHGSVSTRGVVPLAPSFDTVGWLARAASVARAVGGVLLPPGEAAPIRRLALIDDAFALVDAALAERLRAATVALADRAGLEVLHVSAAEWGAPPLAEWAAAFRTIQLAEAHEQHGAWVAAHPGALGTTVASRFALAAAVTDEAVAAARLVHDAVRRAAAVWLEADLAVALPSAHGPAPLVAEWSGDEPERVRTITMPLTAFAGLVGAPAVSLPAVHIDGLPVGLGLVARPGCDLALLDLADLSTS